MQAIMFYLAGKPMVTLLICLGFGFLIGGIKTGKFPNNSTLGTILAAIVINLLIRGAGAELNGGAYDMLSSLFFAMFTFALGYSAGPALKSILSGNGLRAALKQALLSAIYSVSALGVMRLIVALGWTGDAGSANGLLAGAQTQSSVLDKSLPGGGQMVAYAVSYVIGTLLMIVYVRVIVPAMTNKDLKTAVREHKARTDTGDRQADRDEETIPSRLVQLRAYRAAKGSKWVGMTVTEIEENEDHRMEVVALYRGGAGEAVPPDQDTRVEEGDVLTVVGDVRSIYDVPNDRIEEVNDSRYLKAEIRHAEIVITKVDDKMAHALTSQGLLLQSVQRGGKTLTAEKAESIRRGDVIRVAGLAGSVKNFAGEYGYISERSGPSSIPAITLAIALAAMVGSIAIPVLCFKGVTVTLGTGCCAILAGMICGYYNQLHSHRAYVPGPALTLMRSLGLNLFIASVTLSSAMDPAAIFSLNTLRIIGCACIVALLPLVIGTLIGKYALKLDLVELLGGLCGSGTCTAALNALEEETASSVFTTAYTPAYIIGNIGLTLAGVALRMIL